MTGSIALDVVIGLIFIFLLYSLLASIIQEWLASLFSFRAKFLEKAIIRMLEDGNANVASNFFGSFFGILKLFFPRNIEFTHPVANAFYEHPLIKYLAEDDYHKKPSYLTAQNFSKTIIDLLRGNEVPPNSDPKTLIEDTLHNTQAIKWKRRTQVSDGPEINEQTLDYLRSLWVDSQGDVAKFSTLLEGWFDSTMERVTGWYKKHTQALLLIIGLLIAIVFNVNTIQIAKNLAKDPDLRAAVVKQAGAFIEKHPNGVKTINHTDQDKNSLEAELDKIPSTLGTGWTKAELSSGISIWNKFSHGILGWMLTAFAISLGAPFWFDLLNKLMKLRASVTSGDGSSSAPAQTGNTTSSTQTVG